MDRPGCGGGPESIEDYSERVLGHFREAVYGEIAGRSGTEVAEVHRVPPRVGRERGSHAPGWGDTENIVKALIKLTLKYPGKEIVVVWDNASYHNSKELNLKLEEVENLKRIQFI